MSTNLSPGMVVSTKKWPRWWLHPRFWGAPKSGTVLSWSDPRVTALVEEKRLDNKNEFVPVAWDSGVITLERVSSLQPYQSTLQEWKKARQGMHNEYLQAAATSVVVALVVQMVTTYDSWMVAMFVGIFTFLCGILYHEVALSVFSYLLVIIVLHAILRIFHPSIEHLWRVITFIASWVGPPIIGALLGAALVKLIIGKNKE